MNADITHIAEEFILLLSRAAGTTPEMIFVYVRRLGPAPRVRTGLKAEIRLSFSSGSS